MAEIKGLHRLKLKPASTLRRRPDVVPLAALAVGALSFVSPFAALKENRVVDGLPVNGAALAGWFLGGAALAAALAVIWAAFTTRRRAAAFIYTAAGIVSFWLTAALLARGGAILGSGAAPRISPAAGFWGLPAASYMFIDHSRSSRSKRAGWVLLLLMLLPSALILSGGRGEAVSVYREWTARRGRFLDESLVHVRLFTTAVIASALLGVPLGILASRNRRFAGPVVGFVDAVQTIPSMALFGLLMAPLAAVSRAFPLLRRLGLSGIGAAPALIALTLYALLPVVRNTVTGLAAVPHSALDAGRGMGMSPRQLFLRVEWPMALPHVLTGLRTASVQAVGNTAIAALIGAGGLGIMIFQGLGQAAPDLILLGVLPLILMAVLTDRAWGFLILRAVPKGLRPEGNTQ
jgi:osmoprotectant transport system permease protein